MVALIHSSGSQRRLCTKLPLAVHFYHQKGDKLMSHNNQSKRNGIPVRTALWTALWLMAFTASDLASAQSNVTIYGLIDLSMGVSSTGSGVTLPGGSKPGSGSSRVTRMDPNVALGSRLGFRGTEDLGDGLRANFLLEMGFAGDTGALTQGGLAFGRQAYMGLSGSNWALTMGRQYSLLNVAVATSEAFVGGYWGNVAGPAMGNAESLGSTPGNGTFQLNTRVDNSILMTASSGAFTGNLMLAAGNENTRGTGRSAQASVVYQQGPLRATAAYGRLRQNAEQIVAAANPEWLTQWTVGGSYDFQSIKVFGGYFSTDGAKNKANFTPVATVGAPGASPFAYLWDRQRIGWVSARVPLGQHSVAFSLSRTTLHYDGAASGNATTLGLVYEYLLSKRTTLYTNYGQVINNNRSRTGLYGAIPAVLPSDFGSHPKALSMGMYHRF